MSKAKQQGPTKRQKSNRTNSHAKMYHVQWNCSAKKKTGKCATTIARVKAVKTNVDLV